MPNIIDRYLPSLAATTIVTNETGATPTASTQTEKEIGNTPTTSPTILAIEDNASLSAYLSSILSPHYQVILTENGLKAIDLLNASAATDYPSLILSDSNMPEMNGYQLLKILKSKDSFRSIPVILLTPPTDAENKRKALRVGVDDYVLKPFEKEELFARIENLLLNYQERQGILQTTKTEEISISPTISKEDQTWLEKIETHLYKELSNNNYTITQLSYDVALSERQLRRRIKQLVGLSPSQYFKSIRLQHARKLLEQKRYNTITQTAAAVGFQDASAFSRNFSKQFGKSPSSYLK